MDFKVKFKMEYKNKLGTILFSGGEGGNIKVLSIEGLGLPKKNYTTIEYASENGVTQIGEKDMQRTITMTCELVNGTRADKNRIDSILHENGELYCYFDDERRKIKCKINTPPEFSHEGACFWTFTVQLIADYPYFTDFSETEIPIYSLKNLVTNTFTLPCVFTERLNHATILNEGGKYVYPIIKISATGTSKESSNVISIANSTINSVIKINYVMSDNETITINLKSRMITSDKNGVITDNITDDTILSNFYLTVGKNDVSFTSNDTSQAINAIVIYTPEYYSCEV